MNTMTLSLTLHGINRILKRGFELDVVTTLQQVGAELNLALDAVGPMLNKKMLKFKYGGKQYSGTEGRIKTVVTVNNRVFVDRKSVV